MQSDTITIVIHNSYPCYYVDYEAEFRYTGSIPGHLTAVEYIPEGFTLASSYGADDGEIWCKLVGIDPERIGDQFHQGDIGVGSLKIHVEQPAQQGATYILHIKLHFEQYNEASI